MVYLLVGEIILFENRFWPGLGAYMKFDSLQIMASSIRCPYPVHRLVFVYVTCPFYEQIRCKVFCEFKRNRCCGIQDIADESWGAVILKKWYCSKTGSGQVMGNTEFDSLQIMDSCIRSSLYPLSSSFLRFQATRSSGMVFVYVTCPF